jgi:hypothetical protein
MKSDINAEEAKSMKRLLSTYSLYVNEHRPKLMREQPSLKFGDATQILYD